MATIPQARFVRSLNEGRGEDPVKTSNALAKSVGVEMFAQRRTGRRPRQNLSKGTYDQAGIAQQRSTKDGEKTPSKLRAALELDDELRAQRRTGRRPRQNANVVVIYPVLPLKRSTKDGEETPSKHLQKEAAYVRLKRKTLNE